MSVEEFVPERYTPHTEKLATLWKDFRPLFNFLDKRLQYHCRCHTFDRVWGVPALVHSIGTSEGIPEPYLERGVAAGVGHDVAWLHSRVDNEPIGAYLTSRFMKAAGYGFEDSDMSSIFILGTNLKWPLDNKLWDIADENHLRVTPYDRFMEDENARKMLEIVREADTCRIGTTHFERDNDRLRRGRIAFGEDKWRDPVEWYTDTLFFLENVHRFYTQTAIDRGLPKQKAMNIDWVKGQLEKARRGELETIAA